MNVGLLQEQPVLLTGTPCSSFFSKIYFYFVRVRVRVRVCVCARRVRVFCVQVTEEARGEGSSWS